MTFMELAKERYSERYFDTRPVEQEKIDKILEAGRTSPTACNYQPQRIYVIHSDEALKKVRTIRVSHFNAPLMMLVCYDSETAWRNPRDKAAMIQWLRLKPDGISITKNMRMTKDLNLYGSKVRGIWTFTEQMNLRSI